MHNINLSTIVNMIIDIGSAPKLMLLSPLSKRICSIYYIDCPIKINAIVAITDENAISPNESYLYAYIVFIFSGVLCICC